MRNLFGLATALTTSLVTMPLYAQTNAGSDESASSGITEVIVTAQRRTESAQDVPIAISAFSAEQLTSQGVSNTLQIGQYIPNMVAQNNTGLGSANAFYLRGLGNSETVATFDPPVGTYVDDIYLSRQNANNLSLFDVERVEVLRGPQGTLFGRNTTGGAVRMIMADPGEELGGYAEIGYGRYNKQVARGSIDVPVLDKLALKFSGYWQEDDGYVKNVTTGDRLNDDDGWGARVGLKADFTDALSWSASFARIEADGENILNFQCNPANPADCNGRFVTTGLREGATGASPYAPLVISGRKANYLMGARAQTDLVTSNFQIDLSPDFQLSFITGYVDTTQQYALDFYDGRGGPSLASPNPPVRGFTRGGFTILNDGSHEQFSQEIKLNGSLGDGFADLVAGVYYLDEKNTTDFADIFGDVLLLADRVLDNTTEALAGYAQADFNVTDEWKLTAGIRYTDETKKMSIRDNRPSCNDGTIEATCMDNVNLISPSGKPIPREMGTDMWTPRFAVNYQPSGDVLLFASATRGMKSGGWNARSTPARSVLPFGPEKVWSYETGAKTDWLNNRLRANLTFFYLDVADLQTPSALLNANGSITFLTRNFADYENKGIELELTYMPIDGLTTYLNVGYQDDKYKIDRNTPDFDEYGIQSVGAQQRLCQQQLATGAIPNGSPAVAACAAGVVTAEGQIAEPVRTPDVTLSFGASYDIPLGSSRMTLVPSINASYRTEQEVATNNLTIYSGSVTGSNGTFPSNPYSGDYITGSYSPEAWFVNATLTLFGADDRWLVAAECTNCFNETAVNTSLANTAYINAPMQWMLRTRFNF